MAGKKQLDPQEALEKVRNVLADMPSDLVTRPVVPPQHMVGEGNALYLAADRFRDELAKVGISGQLIDELPNRVQALAGAQAQRSLVPGVKRSAGEVESEEAAYNLRQELIAAGRYALRTNPKAQAALDQINEGTGFDDLVQDLKALTLFCNEFKPALKAIGVDVPGSINRATELATRFEKQLAERRVGTDEERAATDLRNRAAAYLWEAMSEIRAAGTFAFRNDPANQALFRSPYRRRHRGGAGEKATGGGETGPTTPTTPTK